MRSCAQYIPLFLERDLAIVTVEMDSGERSYLCPSLRPYLMVVQRVEGLVCTLVHRVLRDVRHKTEPTTLVSTFSGH